MVFQSDSIQLRLYRLDESCYVGVARSLCGVELLLNHIVGIVLQILQTQVLEFALQFVQTQFVGEGSVQIACLFAHTLLGFELVGVSDLPHHIDTVGYHDQNHTHVFRERDEQVAEVLALDDRIALVEFVDSQQTADDVRHAFAIFLLYVVERLITVHHTGLHQDGDYSVASESYFVDCYLGCLQSIQYGIEPKDISAYLMVDECVMNIFSDQFLILGAESVADSSTQSFQNGEGLFPFFGCKSEFFVHNSSLFLKTYCKGTKNRHKISFFQKNLLHL